ncbi:MAG: sugar phosphate isomerase/epimerase family protein [Planctomycetota bacterium]
MAIPIGINSWVWTSPFTDDTLGLIQKAKDFGFDTFELPLEDPAHVTPAKAAEAFKKANIRPIICGAFGPGRDLSSDSAADRNGSLAYIKSALKLCKAVGATVLGGPMYSSVGKRRQVPDKQRKKEWDQAVKGVQKAGKMAADHGVTLGVEPINRFEIDLINTSAQALKFVTEVGLPNVGIHLDTFHVNIEEKSFHEAITTAGKHLVHLHVCENDRGTPGTGLIDWKQVAKALKEVDYKGDATIESFTPECKTIAAAAAIWRKLAPSQDEMARDGLKFLRKLLK